MAIYGYMTPIMGDLDPEYGPRGRQNPRRGGTASSAPRPDHPICGKHGVEWPYNPLYSPYIVVDCPIGHAFCLALSGVRTPLYLSPDTN